MEADKEIVDMLFNYEGVMMMMAALLLNLIIVSAIIVPKFVLKQRKDFAISLYLFNFIIFVLCYVLSKTNISFGAGIGLFAVFTMLRFRSEMLNLPDMTYLLIVISIGFVNAAFNGSISFAEIAILNISLCAMVYVLDKTLAQPKLKCNKVKYDNMELIKPEKNIELVKDLSLKTGLKILKVRIDSINLNEKNASIMIYYRDFERKNGNENEGIFSISKIGSIFRHSSTTP